MITEQRCGYVYGSERLPEIPIGTVCRVVRTAHYPVDCHPFVPPAASEGAKGGVEFGFHCDKVRLLTSRVNREKIAKERENQMKADMDGIYVIKIRMENAAFDEPHGSEEELARILGVLSGLCVNVGPYEGTIHDSNGNTIGTATVENRKGTV